MLRETKYPLFSGSGFLVAQHAGMKVDAIIKQEPEEQHRP